MSELPLVSICIPNYNYARYLHQCLNSACNQTYKNIEILFNDNASSDNSYEIAIEYKKRYGNKFYFYVGDNRFNIGSDKNCVHLLNMSMGKYVMFLSSDDFLDETYVERCVEMMENRNLAMVIAERNEIDENNNITKYLSFFNQTFTCSGEDMASVFMLSGIGIPSQCMMNRSSKFQSFQYINYSLSVAGDWMANFAMSCVGDIGYINKPLVYYRVHTGNETTDSERNLTAIMEHYLLINVFIRMAKNAGFTRVQKRRQEAIEKLGKMCLRYARKMLLNNEGSEIAQKYLHLALIFHPGIEKDSLYERIQKCCSLSHEESLPLLHEMAASSVIKRTISYNPPENYTPYPLEVE